eukprot:364454-Chlamydomonas_euryale.AAC.7
MWRVWGADNWVCGRCGVWRMSCVEGARCGGCGKVSRREHLRVWGCGRGCQCQGGKCKRCCIGYGSQGCGCQLKGCDQMEQKQDQEGLVASKVVVKQLRAFTHGHAGCTTGMGALPLAWGLCHRHGIVPQAWGLFHGPRPCADKRLRAGRPIARPQALPRTSGAADTAGVADAVDASGCA